MALLPLPSSVFGRELGTSGRRMRRDGDEDGGTGDGGEGGNGSDEGGDGDEGDDDGGDADDDISKQ